MQRGAETRAILEGYARTGHATPDAWGRLEEATEVATRETTQRLEAEEQAEGRDPW